MGIIIGMHHCLDIVPRKLWVQLAKAFDNKTRMLLIARKYDGFANVLPIVYPYAFFHERFKHKINRFLAEQPLVNFFFIDMSRHRQVNRFKVFFKNSLLVFG